MRPKNPDLPLGFGFAPEGWKSYPDAWGLTIGVHNNDVMAQKTIFISKLAEPDQKMVDLVVIHGVADLMIGLMNERRKVHYPENTEDPPRPVPTDALHEPLPIPEICPHKYTETQADGRLKCKACKSYVKYEGIDV